MKKQINRILTSIFLLTIICSILSGKTMPDNMTKADDGKMLMLQQEATVDFYDLNQIKTIELEFSNQNWKQKLTANYTSKIDIPAKLIYDGKIYEDVGVRYRGQTSYMQLKNSDKKSFNISLDFTDDELRIDDYKTINLLNCYDDPSFIKEALFTDITGHTIPAAKSNYVKLVINGESWGIYYNIQQLNSSFYEDWFADGDGINWRAEFPDTSSVKLPPGPNRFGAGYCTLNYLGANPVVYQNYYTLKSSSSDEPWYLLMKSCEKLNNLPVDLLYDSLKYYLDVDRALWHIANEIILADDDGYVNKGGMDYYVFYDLGTNRLNSIEYDGNSTFMENKSSLSIFYKEIDSKYPLINRLLQNAELKQRYIAHVRTIIDTYLDTSYSFSKLDLFKELIEEEVLADNKKIYSNAEFYQEITKIRTFINNRLAYLKSQTYFKDEVAVIEDVVMEKSSISNPDDNSVTIRVKASHSLGMSKVVLYHGSGLQGVFEKINMQPDNETKGVYTAKIPAYPAGSYVRYYIEAIADNSIKTASYLPEGAEHDVFFYQVEAEIAENSDVVINELMAKNTTTIADPQGEYDDWIELFNKSTKDVNLGGKYLTDKVDNLTKWQFPDNTIIKAGGYLIVWADENGNDTPGLHANFKLSGDGEVVILIDSDANGNQLLDSVNFGPQQDDISYGRLPNGSGAFQFVVATPNAINLKSTDVEETEISDSDVHIYPNPFRQSVNISVSHLSNAAELSIYNQLGEKVRTFNSEWTFNTAQNIVWDGKDDNGRTVANGIYYIKLIDSDRMIVKQIVFIGK